MTMTMDEVARRLTALEAEVAVLRQRLKGHLIPETPAERDAGVETRGAQILRDAKANQAAISASWDRAMAEMGVRGEPIAVERLQEMQRARGVDPEGTALSRGIAAMREE